MFFTAFWAACSSYTCPLSIFGSRISIRCRNWTRVYIITNNSRPRLCRRNIWRRRPTLTTLSVTKEWLKKSIACFFLVLSRPCFTTDVRNVYDSWYPGLWSRLKCDDGAAGGSNRLLFLHVSVPACECTRMLDRLRGMASYIKWKSIIEQKFYIE